MCPAQLWLWVVPLSCAVSREHMVLHGVSGSVKANVSSSTCGCKAACMGCVTGSLCLILIYSRLLHCVWAAWL